MDDKISLIIYILKAKVSIVSVAMCLYKAITKPCYIKEDLTLQDYILHVQNTTCNKKVELVTPRSLCGNKYKGLQAP